MFCRAAGDNPGIGPRFADRLVQVEPAGDARQFFCQRLEALPASGDQANQVCLGQAGEGKGMKSTETAKADDSDFQGSGLVVHNAILLPASNRFYTRMAASFGWTGYDGILAIPGVSR